MGLRVLEAQKYTRPRRVVTVTTEWGPVRVKLAPDEADEGPQHYAVEYEDCARIARRTGIPLKEIYRRVERLFTRQQCQASSAPPEE